MDGWWLKKTIKAKQTVVGFLNSDHTSENLENRFLSVCVWYRRLHWNKKVPIVDLKISVERAFHKSMLSCSDPAYCRNSVDGQWYSYDDSSVDLVPEDEVCTKGAYILFYQRRNIIPPWSASSSVRGTFSVTSNLDLFTWKGVLISFLMGYILKYS